ncbi:hypothetical protein C6I21_11485 [Alkalicoccus urumqiensis]|uniref:VanZ-like domain-containing protein n=2 Tax=Alkalicoccus urumqiensis TaxID=1548213 RepID=A0A2P6MFG9_ALKUR|nr:hypothetical protein C6I21_11485 [Alkalicoccus urumqiensis]
MHYSLLLFMFVPALLTFLIYQEQAGIELFFHPDIIMNALLGGIFYLLLELHRGTVDTRGKEQKNRS